MYFLKQSLYLIIFICFVVNLEVFLLVCLFSMKSNNFLGCLEFSLVNLVNWEKYNETKYISTIQVLKKMFKFQFFIRILFTLDIFQSLGLQVIKGNFHKKKQQSKGVSCFIVRWIFFFYQEITSITIWSPHCAIFNTNSFHVFITVKTNLIKVFIVWLSLVSVTGVNIWFEIEIKI